MELNRTHILNSVQKWRAKTEEHFEPLYLIYNRTEWKNNDFVNFTDEELDQADERGYIATVRGVKCYLSRNIPNSLIVNRE